MNSFHCMLSNGCNTPFVGIGMIGNFIEKSPTEQAVNASVQLIEYIKSVQSNMQNEYEFITHDDAIDNPGAATLCPGEELYSIWKEHDDFVNETSVCKCMR